MSIEAARRLVESLDSKISEEKLGKPFFNDPNVRICTFDRDGFRQIRHVEAPCKIAFVDGGNQEILGAPNFSVQINRVYFSMWSGRERILEKAMPRRIEFFSSTYSRFDDGQIFYDTSIFPVQEDHKSLLPAESDISFNSFDRTVTIGTQRADIGRVASIARVFAEWQFAIEVVRKELDKGDVIIVDRTLQTTFKNEHKYLAKLVEIAKEKGVIITGLSKTSALFTDTGLSLIGALGKLAYDCEIEGEWYFPIAEIDTEDHNVMILAIELCNDSDRIFRYEIQREQFKELSDEELHGILTQLVRNSCDLGFPGYPYGLIDADRFARISFQEVEYYWALLLSQLSGTGKWEKLSRHIRASDAHNILNMLVG
jgi:hypothetical protein